MVAGILLIHFRIHDCNSLKTKRKIVKSIIQRLKNTYNASVSEVGANDNHHKAEIGVAIIGNDRRTINSKLDKIIDMAEDLGLAELLDTEIEIISF